LKIKPLKNVSEVIDTFYIGKLNRRCQMYCYSLKNFPCGVGGNFQPSEEFLRLLATVEKKRKKYTLSCARGLNTL
jgi:hypothetical protein